MKKTPLYLQVIEQLKERIRDGDYEYDAPLITEEKITQEYNVSRITAIRALDELEKMGLIYRKRGSGSFVTEDCQAVLESMDNVDSNTDSVVIRKNKEVSLIALVLPFDVQQGGLMNCFNGINEVLNKGNCFVRVYNTNSEVEEEATVLRELLKNDIDGVICYPEKDNKNLEIFNQFLMKDIPLVLIDRHIENMPISYVVSDNFNGAKLLCDYAIERGHEKIGFLTITDISGISSLRERYLGYAMSMTDHGKEVNLDRVMINDIKDYSKSKPMQGEQGGVYKEYIEYAIKKMRKIGTTAIICQNDWVAKDVIVCCDKMGISVPDEMLVMGFDHINAFQSLEVGERITTVEQNFYEIGKKVGEVILDELQHREGRCIRAVVPMKLIEGSYNRI